MIELINSLNRYLITLSNKVPTQSEETPPNQPIGLTVQIVIDTLSARIKSGGYQVDTRLPSERALANELGVSRNTVREALDYLIGKNFITRRPGSGGLLPIDHRLNRPPLVANLPNKQGRWTIWSCAF